jgi:transcriptional regulator with XRE-family HTH domain
MKSFGQRLRDLREERGLSPRELARESGVKYETIYRVEHGIHHEPRLRDVVKLARALRVSLDTLAGLYEHPEQDAGSELVPTAKELVGA